MSLNTIVDNYKGMRDKPSEGFWSVAQTNSVHAPPKHLYLHSYNPELDRYEVVKRASILITGIN